jgi:murein DD-endopeptidase MepM/ murein hydrolase activator NlpD
VRRITQYFGWRHTGLDIAGKLGTPIYATRAGKVIKSQCGWNGGYGCYIIIDHGGGVISLYGHNSQLFVSVGDKVVQGQNISVEGSTGRSTGPHLHFEIRVNGVHQNPLKYIR